ncbi:hypothetical protein [Celerinatantimonas sp. MCCC 1A17872]|uniref:hypothetical protein n=1 Tax=Celerinatantimonas sp. MCCC 1A17872 TaxID=3177514 RepID=UPI0038CADD42
MSEYRYTKEDRIKQLKILIPALENLIAYLKENKLFLEQVGSYESALEQARRLLMEGFTQQELSALGRSVSDLFFRHKEWVPPFEQENLEPAKWFVELEKYLQPALSAAGILSIIGYY